MSVRARMSTAPCDDCGKPVVVPEDWPVDWAYCPACKARNALPFVCDVAGCEAGFATMPEVVAHETSHRQVR